VDLDGYACSLIKQFDADRLLLSESDPNPPLLTVLFQDSQRKIILGSSTDNGGLGRNSKKNRMVNSSNSGIISATKAISSGFTALKAGVMEAAAGRKNQQSDSPLVSAESMAVPNHV
jgi:hypothetical protein